MLNALENQGQRLLVSAITLLEVAVIFGVGNRKHPEHGAQMLDAMEVSFGVEVLPMSFEVAIEVASMGDALRDPYGLRHRRNGARASVDLDYVGRADHQVEAGEGRPLE